MLVLKVLKQYKSIIKILILVLILIVACFSVTVQVLIKTGVCVRDARLSLKREELLF